MCLCSLLCFVGHGAEYDESGKRMDIDDDDDDQEIDSFERPQGSHASTEDLHSESPATDTPSIQRQSSSQLLESSTSPAECNSSPYFGDRRRSHLCSSSSSFSSPSPCSSLQDDSCGCKRYEGYENTSDVSLTIRANVFLSSFDREDSSSSLAPLPCLYPSSAAPSVVDLPLPGKKDHQERSEDGGGEVSPEERETRYYLSVSASNLDGLVLETREGERGQVGGGVVSERKRREKSRESEEFDEEVTRQDSHGSSFMSGDESLAGSLSFQRQGGKMTTTEREQEEEGGQKHALPEGQGNKSEGRSSSSSSILSHSLVIDQKNGLGIGRYSDCFREGVESGLSFEQHHDRASEGSPLTVAAEHNKPKGERERPNRQGFATRVRNVREGREEKYHTRTLRRPTECHTDGEGGSGENDDEEEQGRKTKGVRRRRMSCPGEHLFQREGRGHLRSEKKCPQSQSRAKEEKKQVKDVFAFGRGSERKVLEEKDVKSPHLRYGNDRTAEGMGEQGDQERSMFILSANQLKQPSQTDFREEAGTSGEAFHLNVSEGSRSGCHNDKNDDVSHYKPSAKRPKVAESRIDFSSSDHHRDDKAAPSCKMYTVNASRAPGEKEEVGGIVRVGEEHVSSLNANHLTHPDHSHSHACHHHHLSHTKNSIPENNFGHSPLTRATPMVTTSSPPMDDILAKETSSSSSNEEESRRSSHSSQPPSPMTHHSYFPNHVLTSDDEKTRKIDTGVDSGGSLKRSSQSHLPSPECPQPLSPSPLSPSSSSCSSSPLYSDSRSHSNELPLLLAPQDESDEVSMQKGTPNDRNDHDGRAVYRTEKEPKNKKKGQETYEENHGFSQKEKKVKRDERHHIQGDHSKNSKNTKKNNDQDDIHDVRKQSSAKTKEKNEVDEEEQEKENAEMTKEKRRETFHLDLEQVQRVCGESPEKGKESSQSNPSHSRSHSKEENQKLSMKRVTTSRRKTDNKETSLSVSCPDSKVGRGIPDGKDKDEEDATSHQVSSSSLLKGERTNQHQHPQGSAPDGNPNSSSSRSQTGGTAGDREEAVAAAPSSHRRHLFKGVRPENR